MTDDPVILNPQPEQPQPLDHMPQPPCTIHLLNGKSFVVEDIDAWSFMDQGLFADGKWSGKGERRDVLFPVARVDYIDLDFDTLREWVAKQHG